MINEETKVRIKELLTVRDCLIHEIPITLKDLEDIKKVFGTNADLSAEKGIEIYKNKLVYKINERINEWIGMSLLKEKSITPSINAGACVET